jgi:hypothetical protein
VESFVYIPLRNFLAMIDEGWRYKTPYMASISASHSWTCCWVEVILGQSLLEHKHLLWLVMAFQGLGNLGFTLGTLRFAQASQHMRVALPSHNGSDDAQTGETGDITDHLGQLDVHQLESFLHVLDLRLAMKDTSLSCVLGENQ